MGEKWTAMYLPSSECSPTRGGFMSEDAAWDWIYEHYICSSCKEDWSREDMFESSCAAEWDVVTDSEYRGLGLMKLKG